MHRSADKVDEQVGGSVVADDNHKHYQIPHRERDARIQFLEDASAASLIRGSQENARVECDSAHFDLLKHLDHHRHLECARGREEAVGLDEDRFLRL